MCGTKFNVEAVHIPGKQLAAAHIMSHNPLQDYGVSDTEHNVKAFVQAGISTRTITGNRLGAIREATSQDADLHTVTRYIIICWPVALSQISHKL